MKDYNESKTINIPNLGTLTINGRPSIDNCKNFIKILLDAKRN